MNRFFMKFRSQDWGFINKLNVSIQYFCYLINVDPSRVGRGVKLCLVGKYALAINCLFYVLKRSIILFFYFFTSPTLIKKTFFGAALINVIMFKQLIIYYHYLLVIISLKFKRY